MMIGKKIRQLRKQRDLTQKALAKAMNVADSTISNWEHGRRQPSVSELMRLAEFFDISLSEFEVELSVMKDITKKDRSDESYQTIRVTPLGFSISPMRTILFFLALVLLSLSVLTAGIVAMMLWLSGLFMLVWTVITQVITVVLHHGRHRKQLLISMDTEVFYKHASSSIIIHKKRTTLRVLTIISLLVTTWHYVFLLIFLSQNDRVVWVMLVVLYAIVSLFVSVYKFKVIHHQAMMRQEIPYDEAYGAVEHHAVTLSALLDVLALIVLGLRIVIQPLAPFSEMICLVMMISAGVLATLSFITMLLYQQFMGGFNLFTKDRHEEIIAID